MPENLFDIFRTLRDPAFSVRDGVIAELNDAASGIGLRAGAPVPDGLPVPENAAVYAAADIGENGYTIAAVPVGNAVIYTLTPQSLDADGEAAKIAEAVAFALREPLQIIMTASQYLLSETDNTGGERSPLYAAMLNRSLYALKRLSRRLNVFTPGAGGLTSGAFARFDLVALCEEVAETAGELAGRGIAFKTEELELIISGDKRAINQMLLTLLGNALRYAGDEADIRIGLRRTSGSAVLTVTDNGAGVSSEKQGVIWTSYRAERSLTDLSGAGLGLSVVSAIARRHGGIVLLGSSENEGMTVSIRLPAVQPDDDVEVRGTTRAYGVQNDLNDDALVELSDILPVELYRYLD